LVGDIVLGSRSERAAAAVEAEVALVGDIFCLV
jgi:hypothetical protein